MVGCGLILVYFLFVFRFRFEHFFKRFFSRNFWFDLIFFSGFFHPFKDECFLVFKLVHSSPLVQFSIFSSFFSSDIWCLVVFFGSIYNLILIICPFWNGLWLLTELAQLIIGEETLFSLLGRVWFFDSVSAAAICCSNFLVFSRKRRAVNWTWKIKTEKKIC